jgi:amino-acid N-acetyltransferase
LRGILRYIPQFRERTFVVSIDGAVVTDDNFQNLLLDVAVLRSLNIRVVVVHGASAQIRVLAHERQVQPSDLEGAGVTDAETLKLALTAANRLTHEILEGQRHHRAPGRNPARRGPPVHRQGGADRR